MNKKLIFRILGALASALIIVSVFVPFVSVTGYTTSLWESFELTNSLYLPIMIIVFGAIGVLFFSLNVKTEFAYMSTGAITFFLVIETIDILNQGVFNTLSIGYYFLAIGALLTGIMAFLTNLKPSKNKEEVVPVTPTVEPTMLDQIDKLYNDQTVVQSEISPIQPVDNVVTPIPVQPIESVIPVQPIEQVNPVVEEQPQSLESTVTIEPIQENVVSEPVVQQPIETQPLVQESIQVNSVPVESQPINPVLQEFAQPVNPVVQEFTTQEQNPVVQEFSIPQVNPEPVIQEQPISQPEMTPEPNMNEPIPTNPVLQEFTNPGSTVKPQQSNDLDIFG